MTAADTIPVDPTAETDGRVHADAHAAFVLQSVQPALLGLMDGSVSTLAPLFAAAGRPGDRAVTTPS